MPEVQAMISLTYQKNTRAFKLLDTLPPGSPETVA